MPIREREDRRFFFFVALADLDFFAAAAAFLVLEGIPLAVVDFFATGRLDDLRFEDFLTGRELRTCFRTMIHVPE